MTYFTKICRTAAVVWLTLFCPLYASAGTTMTPAETRQFVRTVFSHTVLDMHASEEKYGRYFSPQYVQRVDGRVLHFRDFVEHMKAQKKVIRSVRIVFKKIIAEGEWAASFHRVYAVEKDGTQIVADVHALFHIKNHQMVSCDELTFMVKGAEKDRDLGSRH